MTCGSTTDDALVLGDELGELTVWIVSGEQAVRQLVLHEWDTETNTQGDPIAWPSAPVLVLNGIEVTAVLEEYEAVDDALAVWTITAEQTATLSGGDPARIRVDGETWWSGSIRCQS